MGKSPFSLNFHYLFLTLSYTVASVDAVTFDATLTNFPGLVFKENDIEQKTHGLIDIELFHRIFLLLIFHELTVKFGIK